MKKNMLITGLVYLLIGIAFLLCGILLDTKLNSLFWGFAGGGIVPGLVVLHRYFYWSRPGNAARYTEKIENRQIDLHDERKEKLRNQSGRYAYVLGHITVCISIVVLSLLYFSGIMGDAKTLILYLGGYAVFHTLREC